MTLTQSLYHRDRALYSPPSYLMTLTALSRLAIRHSPLDFRSCILGLRAINRSPYSLPHRQSRHLSLRSTPTFVEPKTPASDDPKRNSKGGGGPVVDAAVQEQRKKDWSIMRKMMEHMWPQDWGVRSRVVLGLGFLVGGKVNRALNSITFPLTTARTPSC